MSDPLAQDANDCREAAATAALKLHDALKELLLISATRMSDPEGYCQRWEAAESHISQAQDILRQNRRWVETETNLE